jgi:hypothetical protein
MGAKLRKNPQNCKRLRVFFQQKVTLYAGKYVILQRENQNE